MAGSTVEYECCVASFYDKDSTAALKCKGVVPSKNKSADELLAFVALYYK